MNVLKPQLPVSLTKLRTSQFVPEARLEQIHCEKGEFPELQASSVDIIESLIQKTIFTQAQLEKLGLRDVIIEGGDLSGMDASGGGWVRVLCKNVRMAGLDVSENELKNVTFVGCKLDLANFRFAKLMHISFVDCSLVETDFQGAKLHDVSFESSLLDRTEFGQVKAKQVDLRGAHLIEVRGWQFLKGAVLDSTQLIAVAPQLAAALELTIKD